MLINVEAARSDQVLLTEPSAFVDSNHPGLGGFYKSLLAVTTYVTPSTSLVNTIDQRGLSVTEKFSCIVLQTVLFTL